MQQTDLLVSYHSITLFSSEKNLISDILETFKRISAEFHSHWGGFERSLITLYFLEMVRDEVL